MIDYETFARIRHGRDKENLSERQIAEKLQLDRKTVQRWLDRKSFAPETSAKPRPSKLDGFKGQIQAWLERHPYTATQIHLKLREAGYDGGYTILKEYVAAVRPKTKEAYLTLKFAPGQCAQVDWGSAGVIQVGNTRRALSFFVMVLCHSRRMFVEFTLGQAQEQWLSCHQHAFEYFGGLVPKEIMVDNCKTAVLSHPEDGPVVLNPRYADFARHCGFLIKPCGPRRPNEKGRVENAVGYIRKNFLAGLHCDEFAEMNPAVRLWLDMVANQRIHGETRQKPAVLFETERAQLQPLPARPYDDSVVKPAPVTSRCRVTFDSNRYSVPSKYASRLLTMKVTADKLRLYDVDQLVAEHVRSYERHRDFENPDHVKELVALRRKAQRSRMVTRFLKLSPHAREYYEQLGERRMNAAHHVEKILALAEVYGTELTRRALDDAHALSAYSCEYVANLLEQRHRLTPPPEEIRLTHAPEALQLELRPPNLAIYSEVQP
jgi:transposase